MCLKQDLRHCLRKQRGNIGRFFKHECGLDIKPCYQKTNKDGYPCQNPMLHFAHKNVHHL